LSTELAGLGLEVMVSLLGIWVDSAAQEGWISWKDVREDGQGQLYVRHRYRRNELIIHLAVLPETGWRIGRITHTGAYLPNTHFVQDPYPDRHAAGYIDEAPLPELYRRAIAADSVLHRIITSRANHACRERPCWPSCFGGLSAAEHSFVGGAPLLRQPTLCLKRNEDPQEHPRTNGSTSQCH
jgi:hypothetical protein